MTDLTSLYGQESDPSAGELEAQIVVALLASKVADDVYEQARRNLSELVKRAHGHVPVESLAACQAQRDAWAAAFSSLAESVLEGVFYLYDVREDSGGSSFLCTCSHDTDGFPHDQECGAFLMSNLGDQT